MSELLKEIFSILISPTLGTIIVVIASLIGILSFFTKVAETDDKNEGKSKELFFSLLDKNFGQNISGTDLEYFRIIKNSIERENETNLRLAELLEDYIVHRSKNFSESKMGNHKEVISLLSKMIKEENEEKPYEILPDQEKRLMRAIKDSIEHEDKDSMFFNLDELCAVLVTKDKEYQRYIGINKWSIPLAIFGLLFTIIFGITSLTGKLKSSELKNIINTSIRETISDTLGKSDHDISSDSLRVFNP